MEHMANTATMGTTVKKPSRHHDQFSNVGVTK